MSVFPDRRYAGRALAATLAKYAGRDDVTVLALPRGGVRIADEVARHLTAPLDVFVVRKLSVPGHRGVAMGALAWGGLCVMNQDVVATHGVSKRDILQRARLEQRELIRRDVAYREGRPPLDVSGRTVIIVDDGLGTGSTMRAAIQTLRQQRPAWIIAAVPFASPEAWANMAEEADEMACATKPEPFPAVGLWYEDFSPTSDDEIRELLAAAHREREHPRAPALNRVEASP